MEDQLTDKQRLFISEYLVDLNASQAAIRAGYSEDTAGSIGHALLKNVEVAEAIEKRLSRKLERLDITADKVLSEIGRLAFSNMNDYAQPNADGTQLVPDFSKLTAEQMAAIQEIRVDESAGGAGDGKRERVQRTTFKLADKLKGLELLSKYLKLLTDKHEVAGENGGPVQTEVLVRFVAPGGN